MVGIAGDAHIVVEVDAQRGHETLWRIFLSFIYELLRAFAQISVEDALHTRLPSVAEFLGIALGNSGNVGFQHTEELVEVVQ